MILLITAGFLDLVLRTLAFLGRVPLLSAPPYLMG